MADSKKLLTCQIDEDIRFGRAKLLRTTGKHRVYSLLGTETFTLPGNANNRAQTWQNCLSEYHRRMNRAEQKRADSLHALAMTQITPPTPVYNYTPDYFRPVPETPEPRLFLSVTPIDITREMKPVISLTPKPTPTPVVEQPEIVPEPVIIPEEKEAPVSITPTPAPIAVASSTKSDALLRAEAQLDINIAEVVEQMKRAEAEFTILERTKKWLLNAPEGWERIFKMLMPALFPDSIATPRSRTQFVPTEEPASIETSVDTPAKFPPLKQMLLNCFAGDYTLYLNTNELLAKLTALGYDSHSSSITSSLHTLAKEGKVVRGGKRGVLWDWSLVVPVKEMAMAATTSL